MHLCPTHLMPSAWILSLHREKEFVNFGFILELLDWLESWELGASCKYCSLCGSLAELSCAVGYFWALLGNGHQPGNHLEWKQYRRTPCAEQRSHTAVLPALSFSVCGNNKKRKTMFYTSICTVERHFETRQDYFLYVLSRISDILCCSA